MSAAKKRPAAVPESGQAAAQPQDTEHYTVGAWKGLPQYRCRHCPFDTLHEKTIRRHVIERHVARPARQPVTVPIYDRFGNLITEREV